MGGRPVSRLDGLLALLLVGCGDASGRKVTVLRGTVDSVNVSRTAVGFDGRRTAGPRLRVADTA